MKIEHIKKDKQSGFTLVELAIVMIIIGLLIGGILKGQELIANSQVTATIAQVKGIDAAISTFRDKYGVLPGDMNNATTRLPSSCGGTCVNAGGANAGDGRINNPANELAAPTVAQENNLVFIHLAAADLITGIDIQSATATFGSGRPSAKAGGGFWLAYSDGTLGAGFAATTPGHYLMYTGTNATIANNTNGAVPSVRAAQIDRKLDDGSPNAGGAIATGTACRTAAGIGGDYDEDGTGLCHMALRIQG